ncbi:Hypothetical protein HVR_LOCUS575 [uncultured virus]|nr:Hypothetical protein HVR_LOCUS575 [uncultured virus]
MSLPTGKNAEKLVEDQIMQGMSPLEALLNMVGNFYEIDQSYRTRMLKTSNLPSAGRSFFEDFSIIENFGLSDEFLQKYFIYPSGRAKATMNFVHKTITSLEGQSVIVSSQEDKSNPTYFYNENILYYLPDIAILDGPIYTPVTRYTTTTGEGVMSTLFKSKYDPDIHCGTYYFYEPASDVFMLSNKTLVAPSPQVAYYYIAGDDARNKLSNMMFPPDIKRTPEQLNYINEYLNTVEGKEYSTEVLLNNRTPKTVNIQQSLCVLARQIGIELIIITFNYGTPFNHFNKVSTEIIDTRARDISYDSLYKLKSQ